MAFVLNEEIVQKLVAQFNEANPAYQFDWKTYAITSQQEGRKTVVCLFLENPDYFAVIQMGMFDVSSISSVNLIAKSEIQGVRIRKGLLNTILKIRMHNGEFYKFIFNPKGGKRCPLHADNVLRYRELFAREFLDRVDMKDHSVGILGKSWIALIWIVAIAVTMLTVFITESKLIAIAVFFVTAYGMAWLGTRVDVLRAKKKDKAFFTEIQTLQAKVDDMTVEEYYHALQQITNKPQTEMYQIMYYSQLIQVAHGLGKKEEANEHLKQFPRRYSEGAEDMYQGLVNLLATPPEAENAEEAEETDTTPTLEKETYDIELTDSGEKKFTVLNIVRNFTGQDLKTSKALVDETPSLLKTEVAPAEAKAIKAELEEAGAKVTLK